MSIKKKVTSAMKHEEASTIYSATTAADLDYTALVSYSVSQAGGNAEILRECTPHAFARFAKGKGSRHPHLRPGLVHAHRYRFVMLIEPDENGKELVTGCHCIPDINFLQSDMAGEMRGRNFLPENAVMQVYPTTGEIDIHVFPYQFHRQISSLIAKMEEKEELTEDDVFYIGTTEYAVQQINGNEVILNCVKRG